MALTADNLRDLLLKNLHNDDTFSDPTDLDRFLTLGQKRIVLDSPHTLGAKEGTIAVVATTREYALASDFHQLACKPFLATCGWELDIYNRADFIHDVELLTTIPSGAPQAICIFYFDPTTAVKAWKARFDTIPDASYSVKYWYYWMPLDIDDTNGAGPINDLGFSTLLLWAATYEAQVRNDPDGAMTALQMYQRELTAFQTLNPQGPAYTPVVSPRLPRRSGSTLQLPPEFPAG